MWGSSTSDVHISRNCGLLEALQPGDAVTVDEGFVHLKADLEKSVQSCTVPHSKQRASSKKRKLKLLDASPQPGSMLKERWNKLKILEYCKALCH